MCFYYDVLVRGSSPNLASRAKRASANLLVVDYLKALEAAWSINLITRCGMRSSDRKPHWQ
jgi:hypothetical protein